MDFTDYSAIEAVNWSSLKEIATSPKMYQWRKANPRPDTESLFFGRAMHCALLEPEQFQKTYVIAPDFGDLRMVAGRTTKEEGKANKERRNEWLAANAGKIPLDADDGDRIARMVASIKSHRSAMDSIVGAAEKTLKWTDPTFRISCKARLDLLCPWGVVDIKTAADVSPRGFGAAAARYLYHGQAAFYNDGAIAAGCTVTRLPLLVAVQNCEPWDVAVYVVDSESLEAGRTLYRRLLRRLLECTAADWWPGVAPEIIPLQLPYWAVNQDNRPETEDF